MLVVGIRIMVRIRDRKMHYTFHLLFSSHLLMTCYVYSIENLEWT